MLHRFDFWSGVLKVAHHGSGGSSTAEFLDAVDPAYALIDKEKGRWL